MKERVGNREGGEESRKDGKRLGREGERRREMERGRLVGKRK